MIVSDYISLSNLQAMDQAALRERWRNAIFPFDVVRGCMLCVTQHDPTPGIFESCGHKEFEVGATGLALAIRDLRPHLERIYALRLFYRDLYASNPPELDAIPKESVTVQEVSV